MYVLVDQTPLTVIGVKKYTPQSLFDQLVDLQRARRPAIGPSWCRPRCDGFNLIGLLHLQQSH